MTTKDISHCMIHSGNKIAICDHFCKTKPRKTNFYRWFSYLDNKFIKEICEKCALREAWGSSYKQTKHYKKWLDEQG